MKRLFASLLCATTLVIGIAPRASAANIVPATPTRDKGQSVYLGDTRVYPTGYNIANNNYFKLRDVGTLVGFGVKWNSQTQTVEISTERIPSSTEGIADQAVNGAAAKLSSQRITVDGTEVQMTTYQIGGNNYVKLRDIGKAVNFDVSFDSASRRITINKEKPYQEPASGNAITSWNSTMQKFHAAMADCNWQAEKYLAVAEQYAPAITGKQNGTVRDVIAALDGMKGAPVDAISFDDKPVSVYWANELRMALGDSVENPNNTDNSIVVSEQQIIDAENRVIELVNAERKARGLKLWESDADLNTVARFRAKQLVDVFEHPSHEERLSILSKLNLSGKFDGWAENIYSSYGIQFAESSQKAFDSWMNSPGHRALIISEGDAIDAVSAGCHITESGEIYWILVVAELT